jgi:hypothetical protein
MSASPRQVYSIPQRQELLQEWQQSGISKKAFCQEKGLKYQTFVTWKGSGKKKGQAARESSFVPVVVKGHTDPPFAQVSLKSGAVLSIYQPVAAAFLSKLFK